MKNGSLEKLVSFLFCRNIYFNEERSLGGIEHDLLR